jgi:ABC-type bacteriocin/lantibiotic exporter with double-glycine peptidase domain
VNKQKVTSFYLFSECLNVLSKRDKHKYVAVLFLQALLGLFDLAGVALAGIIGSLSIRGVQSQTPGLRVQSALRLLGLENLNFQSQITILGFSTVALLVFKTILTVIITRRILTFLANRSSEIATDLIARTLNQPINDMQNQNTSEFQFAMSAGISSITMGILGVASTAIADVSLVVILVIGIIYIDLPMAICLGVLFGITALILNRVLKSRAKFIGDTIVQSEILANKKISEVRMAYREILVRDRRGYYANQISQLKRQAMEGIAAQTFLPNVSKYIFEIAILLGAVLTAFIQIWTKDISHAAASLTLFLVAGSRLAPAILRIQQNSVLIQMNFSSARETVTSLKKIMHIPQINLDERKIKFDHDDFTPEIMIENVSFKYNESNGNSISNLNLNIPAGSFVALVGASGAGKSTLADLILGINLANTGAIRISGLSPEEAIYRWPGAIAYVPQNVGLFEGSILDNLRLGFPNSRELEDRAIAALQQSHLKDNKSGLALDLNQQIGEHGSRLSGGQRQRLGIARALFTNPKLIVMDEATSALDGVTESLITDSIQALRGKVTLVIIAHRLSVVRDADIVVYLKEGKVEAVGKFEEIRQQVPEFETQAQIMGL